MSRQQTRKIRTVAHGPRYTKLASTLPSIVPFVGPEAQERKSQREFSARLGANENVFGPSPKVIRAMEKATSDIWMYGDPECHELKAAIARHHGVSTDNVVVGEGIDALLGYLVRLTVAENDPVVTSDGAYPTFNFHVAGYGGNLVKVGYRPDDHEDPEHLIKSAEKTRAKLIYFANPDNPMGTWHSASVVQNMIESVPEGCLLVLDEAYVDTAPAGTAPAIDPNDPRVVRMRTFSKAYGMAGARVGYAIGQSDLIAAFDKVRNHFALNRASQAGALAAIHDQKYLSEVVERIERSRNLISSIASENGLAAITSATNFVAIDCGADQRFAQAVLEELGDNGVFVRKPFVSPQDRCIRVSCGRDEDLEIFRRELPKALNSANAGA